MVGRGRPSAAAVGSLWMDEHGHAALVCHDAVVLVPVVMGPTGGDEDASEQYAQAFAVDAFEMIVRTGQLGRSFCGGPAPTGADHDCRSRASSEVGQPLGGTHGDEPYDFSARDGVIEHTGVHHGGLN